MRLPCPCRITITITSSLHQNPLPLPLPYLFALPTPPPRPASHSVLVLASVHCPLSTVHCATSHHTFACHPASWRRAATVPPRRQRAQASRYACTYPARAHARWLNTFSTRLVSRQKAAAISYRVACYVVGTYLNRSFVLSPRSGKHSHKVLCECTYICTARDHWELVMSSICLHACSFTACAHEPSKPRIQFY
jgi:hypothetical protein